MRTINLSFEQVENLEGGLSSCGNVLIGLGIGIVGLGASIASLGTLAAPTAAALTGFFASTGAVGWSGRGLFNCTFKSKDNVIFDKSDPASWPTIK